MQDVAEHLHIITLVGETRAVTIGEVDGGDAPSREGFQLGPVTLGFAVLVQRTVRPQSRPHRQTPIFM